MNILCFGDSNTYGYDPRGYLGGCYATPWPKVLAEETQWNIQNWGENGREIPGFPVTFPENTDLLIIMLGTNDLLQGNSVKAVTNRMRIFLERSSLESAKILLLAPPAMKLGAWVNTQSLLEDSKALIQEYQYLSHTLGIRFANADAWNIPLTFDGVHFTEEGHKIFGLALIHYLTKEN